MGNVIAWVQSNWQTVLGCVVTLVIAAEGLVRALEALADAVRAIAVAFGPKSHAAVVVSTEAMQAKGWLHRVADAIGAVRSQVARLTLRGKS